MDLRPIARKPDIGTAVADKAVAPAAGSSPVVLQKPAAEPVKVDAHVQQPNAALNLDELKNAVEAINKTMQKLSNSLEFSVDKDSNRTIVKVIDRQTNEVVRQIPTQETLEIAQALDKAQGVFIRQKA